MSKSSHLSLGIKGLPLDLGKNGHVPQRKMILHQWLLIVFCFVLDLTNSDITEDLQALDQVGRTLLMVE